MKRLPILLLAAAVHATAPTWEVANAFKTAYDTWGALIQARLNDPAREGTVDVGESRAWQKVRAAWRNLDSTMNAEYR